MTQIFTDGASRGNPGPGGWGAIIFDRGIKELGGREQKTTNNRMELQAVVSALKYSKDKGFDKISLYTDSGYVVNGATKWAHQWQKRQWKNTQKQPVLHQDLWQELLALLEQISIEWHLLPGHVGIAGNEQADKIATAFADGKEVDLYEGSVDSYKIDIKNTDVSEIAKQKKRSKNDRAGKKAHSYISCVDGEIQKHQSWAECEKRVKGVSGARFKKSLSKEDEKNIIEEFSL